MLGFSHYPPSRLSSGANDAKKYEYPLFYPPVGTIVFSSPFFTFLFGKYISR